MYARQPFLSWRIATARGVQDFVLCFPRLVCFRSRTEAGLSLDLHACDLYLLGLSRAFSAYLFSDELFAHPFAIGL